MSISMDLNRYSTPIKKEFMDSDDESIDESQPMIKKEYQNHSVDDLLHAIDKNISSTSFHNENSFLNTSNTNSNSFNSEASNDPSPIKPLNWKQQQQENHQSLNNLLGELPNLKTPLKENVMQDIPRAPSFDELEFNTKVNRTSSLSRLSGPRQLSSSSICRTFSNKLPNSHSNKSLGGPSTRDNSPSKKSVCFENSPPKIMEYDELTPEHSDESFDEDRKDTNPFESNWNANVKPSLHALPPLPPKHTISSSISSPTKETSIGSVDGSFEDELTHEELQKDKSSLTLEKRLDLVLGSNEVSERVQNDEMTKGSSSPQRSLTKKEEDLIYNIKSKEEIEREQSLRDAADLFEVDLRNNDKESNDLSLAPQLKRRGSNNSLRDEERELQTIVVQNTSAPIVLEDGMKNVDVASLNRSTDDLLSLQSAFTNNDTESFASATEIYDNESEDNDEPVDTAEQSIMRMLSENSANTNNGFQSSTSISTLRNGSSSDSPVKTHKKKLSLSDSINNGLSYISSFGKNMKDAIHKRTDSGSEIKQEDPQSSFSDYGDGNEEAPSEAPLEAHPVPVVEIIDTHDVQSYASSVTEHDYETPRNSVEPSESLPLLDHQTAEPSPSFTPDESQDNESAIDMLDLQPPLKLTNETDEADGSFSDEFKETPLFNTSDTSDSKNVLPFGIHIKQETQVDDEVDNEIPTGELDEVSLNQIETSLSENSSEILKFESEPEPEMASSFKQEFKEEEEDVKPEIPVIKHELPSFNSTLFHDKEPLDDDDVLELQTPPTDYISIWHSQPKSCSPKPQYSVSQRKVSPPEKVLKLLNRRISSSGDSDGEASKRNSVLSIGSSSIDLSRRNSLITTSVSKPSYIRVGSRNSFLHDLSKDHNDSSFINRSLKGPDVSVVDSSNVLANSSDIVLPELTNSSDFANAFKEWEVEKQLDNNNILKDLEQDTEQLSAAKKLKDTTNHQDIKNIWQNGSNDPTPTPPPAATGEQKSRTPSIDTGKIKNFIAQNGVQGEFANVKSSEAVGRVIVSNNEDHSIELEYDQDSRYNSLNNSKIEPADKFVDAEEHQAVLPVIQQEPEPQPEEEPRHKRFISGSSTNLDNLYDLNEEFDKALQIKEHGYATREPKQVIIAKSQTNNKDNDMLDPVELAKPLVPEADNINYVKQREQKVKSKYGDRVPSARVRAPLSNVGDSNLNAQSNKPKSRVPSANTRVISDEYKPGELLMKKREPHVTKRVSVAPNENVDLPKSDLGRLYIHINTLDDVLLDQIKYHKASFKLYLDNGKHVISTPKATLDNNQKIDKEFEVAIEEDSTDLFFTLKVSYHTPDQELVEVVEKTPIKSNRLSRLLGFKQKFKYEKKFITQKKTKDDWDNKFANDGSFGKNKISFSAQDNDVSGKCQSYIVELFNEWEVVKQSDKIYKKPAHLVGKLNVDMLFLPRTSPLETLPPSIKIGYKIADHLVEQSKINYEGYLFQEGGDCDLWKRRFFKIEGTKLIAHQETSKKPRAQINLLKVVDIIHDGKKTNSQRNFTDEILMSDCFKLKFLNGEIINFNAETKELKDEWIQNLEKVVELNKFHQPWVKLLTQNM
ncbi:hypothetical protein WICANDRAFT_68359 [Wickerhamomyces anomalus NRRL Y-366-8]|uniref:PH domain-containing protein n=1 Tax=Wickerhamomyces anomalus (strain ATCC 58044 / CBS 1984 / NCYC 433 / NRRL Y-366-8) TaxID=683960 RepID=A0A1E3P2R5_WICAA|nr:uncharacterized protein WICANDRAFT_68359 [Wickerhamomyces anomalus NRRL Y-366-8]ODQ59776.1 hypothetical protein WICANDRAFT_68359 [Wickerhamomyces anomalus NRRL Y-366-8]